MNQPERLGQRLEAWLEDGTVGAPHDLLEEVLEAFPAIAQRRRLGILPARRRSLAWGVAAAALVAVLGVGLLGFRPIPDAASSPAPTEGWADRFPPQRAADFVRPFQYAVDPSSRLVLQGRDPEIYQFRVVSPTDETSVSRGVVVRTIGSGLRGDPCNETGGLVNSTPTPSQLIDYLADLPGFEASAPFTTAVDGHPATAIDLRQLAGRPCHDMWVFAGCGCKFTDAGPDGMVRRFIAFEVDGKLIVLVIPAEDGDLEASLPTAEAFIDSLHFVTPGSSPTG